MPDSLRVLVADDERLGRKRLLDLLAGEPDISIVGAAATGDEAAALIRQHRPDVAFLDVQMPGLTGLEVATSVGEAAMPVVVFVTAHGAHAVQAFELAATDYLLKPFEDDRFRTALARARAAVALRASDLSGAGSGAERPPEPYLRQIAVEVRGVRRFVSVDLVDHVTADGPYALVHTASRGGSAGETFVVRERMQAFEHRLDPAVFVRTHRSAIVRLSAVEALLVGSGGDYAVRLRGGVQVKVSRGRRDTLIARMQAGA